MPTAPTRVLIVDDNELYRQAFRRNLMIMDYEVFEAENADEAVRAFEEHRPDLVVTDLSMRTPTEGLELIRSIKRIDPLAPIVLISAVGTFEEGSVAKELGAEKVLSKQKIDEHIEELYAAIEHARGAGIALRALRGEVEKLGARDEVTAEAANRLREIIAQPRQHPVILAEAYDVLVRSTERDLRAQLEKELAARGSNLPTGDVEALLTARLPEFPRFEPETRKELITAEFFFLQQEGDKASASVDFSRNIGFSYCFAVENEAKARLRRKLHRFLSDGGNMKLIRQMLDKKLGQLDIFFHQYLLRIQQQYNYDFTIDNIRQVFQRILEHESRYKPDGLKALGIMVVCFGRDYSLKVLTGNLKVNNPLSLKGFDQDKDVLEFAQLLVSLQHFRNPYIHPEISEMEKVSKIRETALDCLTRISQMQ